MKQSRFWQKNRILLKGCWLWFWIINTVLLIVLTFTYSKKNHVETLHYLSSKNDITGIVWESHHKKIPAIPVFYLNQDVPLYNYPQSLSVEYLKAKIDSLGNPEPNYIVFLGEKEIAQRVKRFEKDFSASLILEAKIKPSLIDAILYWLNPQRNVNQVSYVYKIESPKLRQ